jgi:dTDP-4-amino-4,6-dideoxygalactose transaminase
LGSNYNLSRACRLAKVDNDPKAQQNLVELLSKYFNGHEVELYYKGREALEVGLERARLPKGSNVAINGLTCYVVERAVMQANLTPVFVDLAPDSLNFDLENLQKAHKKTPFSAIILQNTLGYAMSDLDKIADWARNQKVLIIEDMAHNFGAEYPDGTRAGTLGDMAITSFSRDKGLDVVSGGALIYKKGILEKENTKISNVGKKQDKKDRLYAIRTWLIRKTTPFFLGKILYQYWRRTGALLSPMQYDNDNHINQMPAWMAEEAVRIWKMEWKEILNHRQKNAKEYFSELDKTLFTREIVNENIIKTGTCLRFPILLKNESVRKNFIKFLARHGIMLNDIFFDTTAAPKRLQHLSIYKKGSCPNAENIADRLFNLPTHINVRDRDVRKIIKLTNEFMGENK